MKPVKLLTLTTRNYLGLFLVLIIVSFGIFYFISRMEVLKSIDEVLYNRKMHIVARLEKNGGQLSPEMQGYDDFRITPLKGPVSQSDHYTDTIMYEWVDNEMDEFRKLTSFVEVNGNSYRFDVVVPRLETHEIVSVILKSLFGMGMLMVIAFYLTTRYLSRKLWKPFHEILDLLNRFDAEKGKPIPLTRTRIEEFGVLNKAITALSERTYHAFHSQKEFIENASHEMQTPLAVVQARLEVLVSDPQLTETQAEVVQSLMNNTQRLSRLNKTLIQLSRIENHQFPERELVAIAPLVTNYLSQFEERLEQSRIKIECNIPSDFAITGQRELIEMLLGNLLKNAIVHNRVDGRIRIMAGAHSLTISNTSSGPAIPPDKLFTRFYKDSANKESWGLGLALIKKICDMNGWKVEYRYAEGEHVFEVLVGQ